MISNNEIRSLYSKFGNSNFPVEKYCIGCQNCKTYSFPCTNCAHYVFDHKLGYPEEMIPEIQTPLDMFLYIHYDEDEIKCMIPKEKISPDAPIKVYPKPRSLFKVYPKPSIRRQLNF